MAAIGCSPLRPPEGVECRPGLAVGLTHYQLSVSLLSSVLTTSLLRLCHQRPAGNVLYNNIVF